MKSFLPLTRKQTALPALFMFLQIAMSELASSQPVQEDPNKLNDYEGRLRLTMNVIIIASVLTILFLIAFFTLCFRRCMEQAVDASVNLTLGEIRATNATVARSLDPSIIETFPTFVYSEVKTQKIGNGALECAICLNEFEDDEMLRLLPKCDHVFHPNCIDAWLQGHVTCPVCRNNLADQQQIAEPVQPEVITETDIESQQPVNPEPAVESVAVPRVRFSRSHSTGHSMLLPGECPDRFTLLLPEDVRKEMMANWKMKRSNSFGSFDRRKLEEW
ncbi:unnamed protein product [Eruca vesicaria subsp. sativa]|uniref:RING-type E3 ubiquitin transferase n=1 Tax=Eruca vesicaria subsp. sativa TaxID=29727 RepID=A0ABC8KFF9_ERUVS|nr:unnamed protein product [Eruca vesicaria subsp. sativa]